MVTLALLHPLKIIKNNKTKQSQKPLPTRTQKPSPNSEMRSVKDGCEAPRKVDIVEGGH